MTNFGNRADCVILLKRISCSILISLDMFMGSHLFCQDSFPTVRVTGNGCVCWAHCSGFSPCPTCFGPAVHQKVGSKSPFGIGLHGAPQSGPTAMYEGFPGTFTERMGPTPDVPSFSWCFQGIQMVFSLGYDPKLHYLWPPWLTHVEINSINTVWYADSLNAV